MFVDEVELILSGGHGGAGKISFAPGFKSGPDGGNGGKGGDLYLKTTTDLMVLRIYTRQKSIEAENGQPGGSNRKFGLDGKDKEILVPVGSLIRDVDTGKELELNEPDQRVLYAKGGLGGRGNYEFRSSTNTTPEYAQPGLSGDRKRVQVILRLIADYGLIGLPNAGKSSLLNELTNAQAKIANYPFTTLEPNLGVFDRKIIADIPGLIEGASEGKGLGIKFLKHIEKVSALLHCVSAESNDPVDDYKTVRHELAEFNPELLDKNEIILLTKTDLVDDKRIKEVTTKLKKLNKNILPVSIHNYDQLQQLISQLQK